MKIKTILSGIRGLLSLGILVGVSYQMIKETLASKPDVKSKRYITTEGELKS